MKRIICTVTNDLTYDQRMHRICGSLAQAGYSVTLVGRYKLGAVPVEDRKYDQARLPCIFQKGKLFYAEFNIRLFIYLLFKKFDAVCAVDLDTLIAAGWASKWKGAKLVYDAHEYFTELPEVVDRPRVQRTWDNIARKWLPRIVGGYSVSASVANAINERYGTKLGVVRNVPRLRSSVPEPGNRTLLYQGVLNVGRGLEQLIVAMKDVDATLILAGKGDIDEELHVFADKMELGNNVQFLGAIHPDDLAELTSKATLGLNLLADQGLNYRYSLANKFLDYIQAGVPSICTDFPEYRAINEKYDVSVLTDTLDAVQLAKIINDTLANEERLKQLRQNCLVAREELCWEKEEARLLEFWTTV